MTAKKFKVGDNVRVRSDLVVEELYGGVIFHKDMEKDSGKELKIIGAYDLNYRLSNNNFFWIDEMLEVVNPNRTFAWAVEQLRKGNKVRRPLWEEGSHWALGKDESIEWKDRTKAIIHLNQTEATDWEIFEEESLSDKKEGSSYNCGDGFVYPEEKVKESIKELKEDLIKVKGHDGRIEFKYAMKIIHKRFGGRLLQ